MVSAPISIALFIRRFAALGKKILGSGWEEVGSGRAIVWFEGGCVMLKEGGGTGCEEQERIRRKPFLSRERVWKIGGKDDQRRNELSFPFPSPGFHLHCVLGHSYNSYRAS